MSISLKSDTFAPVFQEKVMLIYIIILISLLVLEVCYFRIAAHYNIVDTPNLRSSHKRIVLRGGGIIFMLALWMWSIAFGFHYPWLLAGVTLAACASFIDDIHSISYLLRLGIQFIAMFMIFYEVGLLHWEWWLAIVLAIVLCVGATNVYNFMDGINGILAGNSLVVLIPVFILNRRYEFIEESLLIVMGLALLVFCFFNFRNRAKCFAGDVGSIGIAFFLTFALCRLICETGDLSWLILTSVFGVDGALTIAHRMMLHENLGQAHRKHAYQIMSNELGMKHVLVSSIYMVLQLVVSLIAIYVIPDTMLAHWIYFAIALFVMSLAYLLFMLKYYHLHEDYIKQVGGY